MGTKEALPFSTWGGDAKDMMFQLFVYGPIWDGHCCSKSGRNFLYDAGLIERGNGWQWLTREGVMIAIECDVRRWIDGRWHKKQTNQI